MNDILSPVLRRSVQRQVKTAIAASSADGMHLGDLLKRRKNAARRLREEQKRNKELRIADGKQSVDVLNEVAGRKLLGNLADAMDDLEVVRGTFRHELEVAIAEGEEMLARARG